MISNYLLGPIAGVRVLIDILIALAILKGKSCSHHAAQFKNRTGKRSLPRHQSRQLPTGFIHQRGSASVVREMPLRGLRKMWMDTGKSFA